MAVDRLFALRGLLAFVAFTELTAFVRCFFSFAGDDLLGLTYVGHRLFSLPDLSPEARQVLSHSFGAWCLLNSLVLGHLAVFAHYRPLVSLAASAVTLKLGFLIVHSFGFGYINADQDLIFPLVSLSLALLSTIAVPYCYDDGGIWGDENAELLRKMKFPKKRRSKQN